MRSERHGRQAGQQQHRSRLHHTSPPHRPATRATLLQNGEPNKRAGAAGGRRGWNEPGLDAATSHATAGRDSTRRLWAHPRHRERRVATASRGGMGGREAKPRPTPGVHVAGLSRLPAAAWQDAEDRRHGEPDGDVDQGLVGSPRAVAHPGLPRIRTCAINASGSSDHGFAARRCVAVRWSRVEMISGFGVPVIFPSHGSMTRHPLSGRALARAPVGGGFPVSPFRLRGGFTIPPWTTFPAALPGIPYVGLSPVRLQAPGTVKFSMEPSRPGLRVKSDPDMHHNTTPVCSSLRNRVDPTASPPRCAVPGSSATPPGPRGPRSSGVLLSPPSSLRDLIRRSENLQLISQLRWL